MEAKKSGIVIACPMPMSRSRFRVVRREQHRHAVVALRLRDAPPHAVTGHGVEPHRRLVEDEQRRAVDEGLGELEPTHHPTGVGGRQARLVAAQVDHLEDLVDPRRPFPSWHVEEVCEPLDVLASGQGALDGQLLRHVRSSTARCAPKL